MILKQICILALLASVQALPAQWRNAIVKRDVTDLDAEYDYIVGKS
jgi:hypothetical protein